MWHDILPVLVSAQVLGREKQKNLDGNQHKSGSTPHDNAPGWNELLASQSEAAIKADKADGLSPEMLSKRTVEHIKARHHAEDSTVGVEAEYEKDEVTGPLKKAYTKVKETVTSTSSGSS